MPDSHEKPAGHPGTARRIGFETALMVGGLVLFLVLLYEMHVPPEDGRFLTPPLVSVAWLILLWPLRRHTAVRALLLSGLFLMLTWIAVRLSGVLMPFVVVYLFAFLFDPVVVAVQNRWGIPRWISSLAITGLAVGLVVLILLLIVPSIINQVEELAARVLGGLTYVQGWLSQSAILDRMEDAGLARKQDLIAQITTALQTQASKILAGIPNLIQNMIGYVGSVLGLITTITVFPVVHYYVLKDYPYIRRRLIDLFPTFHGKRDYLSRAGGVVGDYLRGQIIISAITAVNVSVLLTIFHVPFSLLIGLIAGLLNMVPTLGALITNILGILIAIIFGNPWFLDALAVFGVLTAQSILEQTVLTPRILSSRVGLHPVLIILSLFVFGYFLGIFGLLIAVPATALLMATYKTYREELTLELKHSPPVE